MLEADDVHKVYRMGRVTLPVLRGVSLRIAPGEFVAVTGPSGAGKSTLLHLIAGLDIPTQGTVRWDGQNISQLSDAKRASFRNQTVGIVFQSYHLLPELSALENVFLPGLVNGHRDRAALRHRATRCLEQVGLGARLKHRPQELSGGEQQRVAIARSIINEPKLLCCDEPTGNLDTETGQGIATLLTDLRHEQTMTLVLVTHDETLAARADARLTLRDGRIVHRETNRKGR